MDEINKVNHYNKLDYEELVQKLENLKGGVVKRDSLKKNKNKLSQDVTSLVSELKKYIAQYKIFNNFFFDKAAIINGINFQVPSVNNNNISTIFNVYKKMMTINSKITRDFEKIFSKFSSLKTEDILRILEVLPSYEQVVIDSLEEGIRPTFGNLTDPTGSSLFIFPDTNLVKKSEATFLTVRFLRILEDLFFKNSDVFRDFERLKVRLSTIGM
tara:strand:- start:172 stop:813 length:642 start_codon:yes stop_codon:yes gene_type:complete